MGALISLVVLVGAFIAPSAVVYLLLLWVLAASVSLTTLITDAPASTQRLSRKGLFRDGAPGL